VQSLNHPETIRVYREQLLEMFYGQDLDICSCDNYTCISLEENKQMSKGIKDRKEP
jgi:hypothetical protein